MSTIAIGYEPGALSEGHLASIHRLAPDMEILVTEDRAEIQAALDEIEIAARRFPHDLVLKASGLRWFQQWGAGAGWLLRYPQVADLDLVVTNASGVHAIPISEHILAFLLAFARGLHSAVRAQEHRTWTRGVGEDVFELAGKTMVLVGVGAIGGRTAEIATALGVEVFGVRRHPAADAPSVAAMYGPDRLLDLLPRADFVVLTVPLTPETRNMIGERELREMKRTAYLVNIGRGGTIEQRALIQALQQGWIAGAGLDVFETEPLPESSPLWQMPNVIITSHYAGRTPHYEERAMAIFVENLERYRAGKPLRNVVDPVLAY